MHDTEVLIKKDSILNAEDILNFILKVLLWILSVFLNPTHLKRILIESHLPYNFKLSIPIAM